MSVTVYTETGQRITLDPNNSIGSGGEGTVFPHPKNSEELIKVYDNPSKDHEKKLKAFIARRFSLPKFVAAPTSLNFNGAGNVVGYTMPHIKRAKSFRDLSNNNFRVSHKINNKKVVSLYLNDAKTLEAIHNQKIVVGDRNDQNLLFVGNNSYYIDFDSVQFDNFACPVATENYLDPALYSIDLSSKPVFLPNHDWYSYAVMLFRNLLLVHPYGGTHPRVTELTHRALQKITVFDKKVIYPSIALPPDVITDDLLHIFNKYFKDGWRGPFPQKELAIFQSALIECSSCNTAFPANKRACPVCKEQNQAVVQLSIPGAITVKKLMGIKGQITYHRLDGENLVLITIDNNYAYMHIVNQSNTQSFELFPYQTGMRFEASTKLLAVNISGSEEINLYEVNYNEITQVENCISNIYSTTQNAVFRVNGSHIYRIVGGQLVDTEVRKKVLLNRPIRSVIENQSWFNIGSEVSPTIVGFYRILRQYFFWMHIDGYSKDLPVPELKAGESLIDISVKYSTTTFLITRKTKLKGVEYVSFDSFDKKGELIYSTKAEVSKLPSDRIHGQAYASGKLVYPTDHGAIRFDPATGSQNPFQATTKVVNSSQSLFTYTSGLLVVDPKHINFITLN